MRDVTEVIVERAGRWVMRTRIVAAWALLSLAACGGPAGGNEGARSSDATGGETASPAASAEPEQADDDALVIDTSEPPAMPIVAAHGPLSEEDVHRGVVARLADPPFPGCTVAALSPALRRRVRGGGDLAALRARVSMEVPDDAITSARTEAGEALVHLSSRLDPRSDVGDLGYRIRLRDAAGNEEDLALGLTALRPLVLVDNPAIPLVESDVVQVEAELRAIDDSSVDFVPADGTRTARDGRERLVRCALRDLRRDQDGDGLRDLEEQRLLTDAWDPDTDGDGVRDGDDASPLGSAAPQGDADAVWLAAARALARSSEGLHVVVRSGPRLHVDGELDGSRLLVLREDELGAYQRRFGLRAPTVIAVTMRGAERAEVVIDTVWSERTLDAHRDGSGAWTLTERTARR